MKSPNLKTNPSRLIYITKVTLRKCLIVLGLFLISFLIWFKNKEHYCPSTPLDMGYIQSEASEIENNIKNYTTSSKDIFYKSTEGGQQTDYIFQGNRVLSKLILFGETGKSEFTYYFKDNKVFYINEKSFDYILPIYEDPTGKIKNVVTREFYFDSKHNFCTWYEDRNAQVKNVETDLRVKELTSDL